MLEFVTVAALLAAKASDDALERWCRPFAAGVAADIIGERYTLEQARSPADPVATVSDHQSLLILPDGRYLLRTSTVYPGDIEFRFRTVADPAGSSTVDELGWREGDKLQIKNGAAVARDLADLRLRLPALAACGALEAKAQREGDVYRFSDIAGRPTTLKIDANGDLASAEVAGVGYHYEGWRVDGQSGRVKQEAGDRLVAKWTVRARSAQSKDAALLAPPVGYAPPAAAGPLRATPLSEGVFRIDGTPSGYHTGFVVGAQGVVVFDAPVGVEEAKAVRAMIEQTAPGLKISHVVISHVHRDHVAGLPAYAEAEVLTGANGAAALRRQLGAGAPARIREVRDRETLDLGDRLVRVTPMPDNQHAATMLVGFDETSGTIFQGDLFYLPERGATPAAFGVSRDLRALIIAENLAVAAIVGVHGRTGVLADLDQSLARAPSSLGDARGCIGRQMITPKTCAHGTRR